MTPIGYPALMEKLCVQLGLCGMPLHVEDLLPSQGTIDADRFAVLVLIADEMDPEAESSADLKAAVRTAFVEAMGSDAVDVALLRY
jgi:hypothetical protein